jgi:hypothetical protein
MDDKELLDFVEQRMFNVMLEGCLLADHLGPPTDTGAWSVSFRSDTIARLLDMAKEKNNG